MELLGAVPLVSAAVAVAAALYSARSWPIGVRARLEATQERLEAAEAKVEAVQAKWLATSAELAAFLEEAEGVLSAVEKKRRRIAASESKRSGQEPADPAERRMSLLKLAREQGHAV